MKIARSGRKRGWWVVVMMMGDEERERRRRERVWNASYPGRCLRLTWTGLAMVSKKTMNRTTR